MRKLIIFPVCFIAFLSEQAAAQEKDQAIEIRSFSINIQADIFVATAVMGIEVYKNFGKPNQTISVQNLIMDNQQGIIGIGELKW